MIVFPSTTRGHFRLLSLAALLAVRLAAADATFTLAPTGALQDLAVEGETLKLDPALGGFFAREAVGNAALDLSKGTLKKTGSTSVFDSAGAKGVSLHAEFTPKDGYVLVTGYLKNATDADRAIILDYRAGFTGADVVYSNSLNAGEDSKITADGAEFEGNAFPVASLYTATSALSAGLTPTEPRSFGMVGSSQGLTVRFYLGITPVTKAFPNQASFSFIIYPSRPGWGFRGALEKYYGFFPANYEPFTKDVGYYMYMVKGIVPQNIDQYSFNVLEIHNRDAKKDLQRDDDHHILSLIYTLVGQREIKHLAALPKNYDEAMAAFNDWTYEKHKDDPVTKENSVAGCDKWLHDEVLSSTVKNAEDKYVLSMRNTPWGENSVSFKVNPSPYLFADKKDVATVGKDSTKLLLDWIQEYPQLDGVIVDSLGANWPAVANHRRDHFEYAQYPLTFDSEGRLLINNAESHFEWVKYMDEKLAAQGRHLFANGVYAYRTQEPEHFRAKDRKARIKLGRFFISSLLDGGASESGVRADTERCQDVRIMFGRKYYSLTNYEWDNEAKVKEFYNRSLAYTIFASNTKNYSGGGKYIENVHEGVSYVDNPQGYFRDKALLDWFLPKAQMLYKAGWQPVTGAKLTVGGAKVYLERYGTGDKVYYAVFNDTAAKVDCAVKVDLPLIGFTEGKADYQELAYDAKLELPDTDEFRLTLEPHQTYIVCLSKTWLWGENAAPKSSANLASSGE